MEHRFVTFRVKNTCRIWPLPGGQALAYALVSGSGNIRGHHGIFGSLPSIPSSRPPRARSLTVQSTPARSGAVHAINRKPSCMGVRASWVSSAQQRSVKTSSMPRLQQSPRTLVNTSLDEPSLREPDKKAMTMVCFITRAFTIIHATIQPKTSVVSLLFTLCSWYVQP